MGSLSRLVLAVFCLAIASVSAKADDDVKAEELITKARLTINAFKADDNMVWFRNNVQNAKGLLIIPQSVKGGFILGGSGGSGTLLIRENGEWSYPAFYTMGSVTFGLQIGAEVSEIVLMIMTERGVERLLTSEFKLGGDISVAAGPVGAGAKAQTVDVLAFARSKGLYGGINLEGAVIKIRNDLNAAFYNRSGVRPRDILIARNVSNPEADPLRRALVDLPN